MQSPPRPTGLARPVGSLPTAPRCWCCKAHEQQQMCRSQAVEAEQSRAEQRRAEQRSAAQSRAEQSRAEQGRAGQSRAEQSSADSRADSRAGAGAGGRSVLGCGCAKGTYEHRQRLEAHKPEHAAHFGRQHQNVRVIALLWVLRIAFELLRTSGRQRCADPKGGAGPTRPSASSTQFGVVGHCSTGATGACVCAPIGLAPGACRGC